MTYARTIAIATCAVFINLATFSAQAQDSAVKSANSDNTEVNIRDRNADERTADQAKNNLPDREVMQQIRKSIMADKSLSTYAHNVKIISEHGKVTLKGPVRSEAERQSIEDKAMDVAGAGNVINEISVKGRSHRS
jgi:osmotically-inducible protein OsmY